MKDFAAGALIGALVGGIIVALTTSESSHHYVEVRGPRIILNSSRTPKGHHHIACSPNGHGMHHSHGDNCCHPKGCRCDACMPKNSSIDAV